MTTRPTVATVLAGALSIVAPAAAQKDPPVADVVRAAGEYLATYAPKVSGVTLQEEYTLIDVTGGRMSTTQRLNSDLVLLNLTGKIIALRDAYSIDSNALRVRQPRITTLLVRPTAAGWEQAQAYAGETARYLMDTLVVRSNDPTLAVQVADPTNQTRLTYKIDGRKKMDGVDVIGLRFQETKTPDASYIVPTPGKAAASGRLWLEAGTGRIHRTELSLQSDTESARIEVVYGRDSALDLWLPKEMVDLYDIKEQTGSNSYRTRSFQGRADYANPRLTPIQLTVPK
ncbi:MAG: hypothetical protein A3H96_18105 [Acidobacteria bacterium RIFCSPLOWO2_02_FULL_67_36]|nr:MAG: hypothetical protein A3H96_18105 [Acidobacteria bacterium RIFCSPLOWO2_02_FULL_67_36]OFW23877.1 MAG: hypothetical protein A3G21_03040 [Acidobacteria bacterium RIFCSPLOWO2_12_FULL_66_21]